MSYLTGLNLESNYTNILGCLPRIAVGVQTKWFMGCFKRRANVIWTKDPEPSFA